MVARQQHEQKKKKKELGLATGWGGHVGAHLVPLSRVGSQKLPSHAHTVLAHCIDKCTVLCKYCAGTRWVRVTGEKEVTERRVQGNILWLIICTHPSAHAAVDWCFNVRMLLPWYIPITRGYVG